MFVQPTYVLPRLFSVLALLLLVSCGSQKDQTEVGSLIKGIFKSAADARKARRSGAPAAAAPALTRASLAGFKHPLISVSIPKIGMNQIMVQTGNNRGYRSYRAGDRFGMTLVAGLMTSSHGFGTDLIAQGLSESASGLFRTGHFPKTIDKVQRHLDGENHSLVSNFKCVIERKGRETVTILERNYTLRLFSELCRSDLRVYENRYWVDERSGFIWKSRQSMSKDSGYVIVQTLIP